MAAGPGVGEVVTVRSKIMKQIIVHSKARTADVEEISGFVANLSTTPNAVSVKRCIPGASDVVLPAGVAGHGREHKCGSGAAQDRTGRMYPQ